MYKPINMVYFVSYIMWGGGVAPSSSSVYKEKQNFFALAPQVLTKKSKIFCINFHSSTFETLDPMISKF